MQKKKTLQNLNIEIKKIIIVFYKAPSRRHCQPAPYLRTGNQRLPSVSALHQVDLAQRHSHLADDAVA